MALFLMHSREPYGKRKRIKLIIEHIKRLVNIRALKPKTIFLVDGLGAVLTAILLMAVVRTFDEYFGMPRPILTLLSIMAIIFALYSFSCFAFSGNNIQKFLRPIIAANLTYSILTSGLVIYFYNRLTFLGVAYFVGEVLIICGLVSLERKILKATKTKHSSILW